MTKVKRKKIKVERNKGTNFLFTLLLLALIAYFICTLAGVLMLSENDAEFLTEYFDQQSPEIQVLLFLINLLFVLCIVLWWLVKYFLFFMPSYFSLAVLIPALVMLKESGIGGEYCYKFTRNRKQGKVGSVLCIVYAVLGTAGMLVSSYIASVISASNEPIVIPDFYTTATYVLAGVALIAAIVTLFKVSAGVNYAAKNNQLSEEEEILLAQEKKAQAQTQKSGYTLGGAPQSLQVYQSQSVQDETDNDER